MSFRTRPEFIHPEQLQTMLAELSPDFEESVGLLRMALASFYWAQVPEVSDDKGDDCSNCDRQQEDGRQVPQGDCNIHNLMAFSGVFVFGVFRR